MEVCVLRKTINSLYIYLVFNIVVPVVFRRCYNGNVLAKYYDTGIVMSYNKILIVKVKIDQRY